MKNEWTKYYIFLEELRKSGIVNMYGATPYLQEEFGLEYNEARNILVNWMKNYNKIIVKIGA